MASAVEGDVYCIDTSALIDLKLTYPMETFPTLWKHVDALISNGRLFAPREVLRELEQRDDELHDWVKTRSRMFRDPTDEIVTVSQEIMRDFPDLVDHQATTPSADPFVVAQAVAEHRERQDTLFGGNCAVITSEGRTGGQGRPRIPNVCDQYQITAMRLKELFAKEGWRF